MWLIEMPWRVVFGIGAVLNVLVVFAFGGYEENRLLGMVATGLMALGGFAWHLASRRGPSVED